MIETAFIHEAEQLVAPDASRASRSHAGCNQLTFIVGREGVIGYHVLCSGLLATVMPLLGPVCAGELER